ncbi:MAG TPA: methylated-DNA--[protein]-cysteine S-methyltransferase [Rhodanobacteraceae bacterium]|nr:methylated-DNA--[protein]-cysteine S-methyltransferase [Rhodanobacteraceae bacterium]
MNTKDALAASATIEDPRWQRVLARDASADGEFFYSVASTGVYCRPSCASRRAKPEHVAFHASAADAERAGFRPCKRCRPDRTAVRGPVEEVRYAVAQSSLGKVLVARSNRGVCAVLLGDDETALRRELHQRFPAVALREDAAGTQAVAAQAVALIESPATARFDLPMDARGTPFQRRVWEALREVRVGSTASYTQIAARIGAPKAVRAVAQACGANPIAVAIPCHRVVRGDGALSGYRWGVQRKRALLQREGVPA